MSPSHWESLLYFVFFDKYPEKNLKLKTMGMVNLSQSALLGHAAIFQNWQGWCLLGYKENNFIC